MPAGFLTLRLLDWHLSESHTVKSDAHVVDFAQVGLEEVTLVCSQVADFSGSRLVICVVVADFIAESDNHTCLSVQVGLKEGALVCPQDGRRFLVKKGIPNLLLDEHEV